MKQRWLDMYFMIAQLVSVVIVFLCSLFLLVRGALAPPNDAMGVAGFSAGVLIIILCARLVRMAYKELKDEIRKK